MSDLAVTVCGVCNGSGWDEVFGTACGECGADLATAEAVEEAKAKLAGTRATIKAHMAERVALVDWLRTQDWEFPQSLVKQFDKKGDLSAKQWATVERLKAKDADPAPRWTKVNGEWGIKAIGHTTGETISVFVKSKGQNEDVVLGAEIAPGVFAKAELPEVELPTGRYTVDGEEWKVNRSRNTGKLYAMRWDEQMSDWEYVGTAPLARIAEANADLTAEAKAEEQAVELVEAAITEFRTRFNIGMTANVALPTLNGHNDLGFWNITRANVYLTVGGTGRTTQSKLTQLSVLRRLAEMTDAEVLEAMATYGRELEHCGRCGRVLTDLDSRERGIGPECANK